MHDIPLGSVESLENSHYVVGDIYIRGLIKKNNNMIILLDTQRLLNINNLESEAEQ